MLQVAELALPGLNIPDFAIRYVWIAAFLLFSLVLVIGWRYDITKHGIMRTLPASADEAYDQSLQRSDPKSGDPADYPTGHGPQGDAIRIYNDVRLVRSD